MTDFDFSVGDLVQQESYNSHPRDGVVEEVIPAIIKSDLWKKGITPEEKEAMTTYLVVKFEDGVQEKLDANDLFPRDNDLQRQFRKTYLESQKEIEEHIEQARVALRKAVKVSEEKGVPFSSGISFLGNTYIPASMDKKFPDLDKEFLEELTETYREYDDECGWHHSAVC